MQLRPEEIGFTHSAVEEAINMLIAAFGYDKTLRYTMPPDLAEDLDRFGRLLCIDVNSILNNPDYAAQAAEDDNVSRTSE